jgi:DNA (cytosine-5)-methyltransferase 1
VDTTKTINHLSLCSGYEGIGSGLSRVLPNLRNIAYVEREGFPAANLVAKMEAGALASAPVHTDVKTFPFAEFRGCVDILSGGFPCQPFSNAGLRQGVEDPRHLFPYIAAGIRECQPTVVFLENVEGILSCRTGDGEPVLQYVLRTLEEMGYRATAGVFSAAEVGAPHQRKRVFILAYRNDERPQGRIRGGQDAQWQGVDGHAGCSSAGTYQRWPARPSEPQHDWEEPRVTVANTESQQGTAQDHRGEPVATCDQEEGKLGGGDSGSLRQGSGSTQSRLGGKSNGSTNRVDRLRLLGNGVVPATATTAFVTLMQRLV